MSEVVVRITSGYFCAGIILSNGRVRDAAPIVKWMRGKTEDEVRRYCDRKRWTWQTIQTAN